MAEDLEPFFFISSYPSTTTMAIPPTTFATAAGSVLNNVFGSVFTNTASSPTANAGSNFWYASYPAGAPQAQFAQQGQYAQAQASQYAQQMQGSLTAGIGQAHAPPQVVHVPPSEEELEQWARFQGHVVLKRAHRHVHVFRALTQDMVKGELPIMPPAREIDGFALPRQPAQYVMPDGSILHTDSYGNYHVEDEHAKVTYKANNVREFNEFINASELLQSFVSEVGNHPKVTQMNVLNLPIEAFINWLVHKAAMKDGDNPKGLPTVEEALAKLPAPLAAAA